VRSCGRDVIYLRYFSRVSGLNSDDPRRRGDIDEERLNRRVINCPTGATGHYDFGSLLPTANIHDRYRMGIRNRGIADVSGDEDAASRVKCKPVGLHAYPYLECILFGARCKYRDCIFPAITRENETALFRYESPCYRRETRHRLEISVVHTVD